MKILKNPLLLPIACFALLAAVVATAEESLEDICQQAALGDATAQPYSGGGLFDTEGNLIGIVTSKLVDENTDGIAFAIPADLALKI